MHSARTTAQLVDVNSDMQQNGLQTYITIERATAQRYGFAPNQIDAVLYDAYGQRTVTTIFNPFNQYYVVMEVAPPYWQFPQMLDRTYLSTAAGNASGSAQTQMQGGTVSGVAAYSAVSAASAASQSGNSLNANAQANAVTNSIANSRGGTSTGSADSTAAETMVPLPAMTTYMNNHTATQVNHQNGLVASTISFNLPPGGSLSRAQAAITQAMHDLGMPASIRGSPAGAGQVFAQNAAALPLLLLAAFGAIYIVLGILYENTIHPITILSTLPSAIIGAILALLIFGTPLSVIAFIGIILLIGIVKKNAIMMIDVALHLQRNENKEAQTRHSRRRGHPSAAHHDDHRCRGARRVAARDRHRPGSLAPSAARHHGDRRVDLEPGVHAVHDARHLSGLRAVARMDPQPDGARARARRIERGYLTMTSARICLPPRSLTAVLAALHGRARITTGRARPSPRSSRSSRPRDGRRHPRGCRPQGRLVDRFSRSVAR